MADKYSRWSCTHSASIVSQNDTTATVRVICYWQNDGWTYSMNNVSAWVNCNGQSCLVKNSGSIDTQGDNHGAYEMGRYDFTVTKGTGSQNISCYATITSASSYVSGTKSSSATSVRVSAKPSYTVSYNANGGSGAPGNQTKWYGTNLTLSSTKPSRTGHDFVRWNINTSNTGTAYNPGGTYSGNSNLTLYAIWSPYTYTVSYNANGGSGAPGNQTKTYGKNLTLSSTKPTRSNYNFKGWSTSSNGGVVYSPGGTYTNNNAVTLYAVWELAYIYPSITNFSAQRCTSNGTISENGTYAKVTFDWYTFGALKDLKIQYRSQTSDTWITVNAYSTGNKVSQIVGDGNLDIETTYIFKAYTSDYGGVATSQELSIGTVKFPIDIRNGGKGVAIGKASEKDAFEIGMDIYDKNSKLLINSNFHAATNDSKFDDVTQIIGNSYKDGYMYVISNEPVNDNNYIQQGCSHTVIGCERDNRKYGWQVSFSYAKFAKIRQKWEGKWEPWRVLGGGPVIAEGVPKDRSVLTGNPWTNIKVPITTKNGIDPYDYLVLSDGGIKVNNSNVRSVKVSGQITWSSVPSGGEVDLRIYQNSNIISQSCISNVANHIHMINLSPVVVNVSVGDTFYLGVSKGMSDNLTIIATYFATNLTVEAV